MKIKFIITILYVFFSQLCLAQWQGSGTEEDPFRIYNLNDLLLIKENEESFNGYAGIHFNLMNDIDDVLSFNIASSFRGYFHGKGHFLTLGLDEETQYSDYFIDDVYGTIDSLSFEGVFNYVSLFQGVNITGKLSHITCNVNYIWDNGIGSIFCAEGNSGIIEYCVNNSNIESSLMFEIGIFGNSNSTTGILNSCINNGNITYNWSQGANISTGFVINFGKIINCINTGNVTTTNIPESLNVSAFGIAKGAQDTDDFCEYVNCLNTGNFNVKNAYAFGGIAYTSDCNPRVKVLNCMNLGNLNGADLIGGIYCSFPHENYQPLNDRIIENCVNAGLINGSVSSGGIIAFKGFDTINPPKVKNNLNLGKTNHYSLFAWSEQPNLEAFENNFYDKQLLTQMSSPQGDILENNAAKGLLTTDITGFALQDILGDGWSYAEGRYPVPLGLENHPAALLAATPVYLPYTDQDNYNTVDSVTCHFLLGTENNVEWECSSPTVNLEETEDGLKGVLQSSGYANLVANLGGFHKNIILNIKSVCEPSYKNEEIQKTQAIAYPNPTKDILYFNQASAYEIYDLQGKLIMKSKKPQNSVNTSKLKSGIYLIKIGKEIMKFVVE